MATVIDLDNTVPSVESVVTRLFYNMEQLASITCVIEWKDGNIDWCGSDKPVKDMIHHTAILQKVCNELIDVYVWEDEDE